MCSSLFSFVFNLFRRVINIQPMASLLTLLDKPIKKTGCVHEDGGVNAIFEEVANVSRPGKLQ